MSSRVAVVQSQTSVLCLTIRVPLATWRAWLVLRAKGVVAVGVNHVKA